MKKNAKKILIFSVGFVFVVLGLLGLVLPFLQGILFLIIGIFLISFSFPKFQLLIKKNTSKYPRLVMIVEKTEQRLKKFLEEI